MRASASSSAMFFALIAPFALRAAQPDPVTEYSVNGHIHEPQAVKASNEHVQRLRAPEGFALQRFADGLDNPRMIAVAPDGAVYVTQRRPGTLLMLRDHDGDGVADAKQVALHLKNLHGVAIDGDRIYLADVKNVYSATRGADGKIGELRTLVSDLPDGGQHPNRTLAIGPDRMLYVTIGSTCNACKETSPESATIVRIDPQSGKREIYARGLRNTIGFGWHPASQRMYGMDHGIDWLGDDEHGEELNEIHEGAEYGWPYVYDQGKFNPQDEPEHLSQQDWARLSRNPVATYTPHSAPMQMTFYTGSMFPQEYKNDAFIAMRGSWNRRSPSGYEVLRVRFDEKGAPQGFETLIGGFLTQRPEGGSGFIGRPTGIAVAKDGALLIGDDSNNVIYRLSYGDQRVPLPPQQLAKALVKPKSQQTLTVTSDAVESEGMIPARHSDYGDGQSPSLAWSNAPKGAKSYVVLMEDPEAKSALPFVHWAAANIPADVTSLPENIEPKYRPTQINSMIQGSNSKATIGYFGPRPPAGDPPHPYHFQVFALDRMLDLPEGFSRSALLEAMKGHVLAQGELIGRFAKPEAVIPSQQAKKMSPSELEEMQGRMLAADE